MEITIYAKKRQSSDGKSFYAYLTRMTRKDGTVDTMGVKFRDDCGAPKGESCPCNIIINRGDANVTKGEYVREDTGDVIETRTLWVQHWERGSEYVDTSLDEYMD